MFRHGPSSWCCNVKNCKIDFLSLDREHRTAVVAGQEPVVRVPANAGLAEIETLVIPSQVETFWGLNRFPHLRVVFYAGDADVFGFREGLGWLAEKSGDPDALLQRLATNLLAAPPVAGSLTAMIAPYVPPLHAAPGWEALLDAINDLAACSNGRQDSSRQNICLCRSFAQLKRLEYAQYMGFGVSQIPYPENTARHYRPEARFTPPEQLLYALALLQGHSYQEFYTADGPHGYTNLRSKDAYLAYLRKGLVWTDTEAFQQDLDCLLNAGLLVQENFPAAVDLLLDANLPGATAYLLDRGVRLGWSQARAADLDQEFQL